MALNMQKIKQRASSEDLTLAANDGLYNQTLFDLHADDSILGLSLFGKYNPALDAIGFTTSAVQSIKKYFLTYVGPDGTAAGSPTSSNQEEACEPGTGVETGFCSYYLDGWGRMRKSSPTRDITDGHIRYSDSVPTYYINGQQITDDYQWDMVRQVSVMLQDFQRNVILGNRSVAGEHDGLLQHINYGYANPETGEDCTSMDSLVMDWSDELLGTGKSVTVNGVSVTDGFEFYQYISSFLRRVRERIANSSYSGAPKHIGLIPNELLNSLVEYYVLYTHLGNDRTMLYEKADVMSTLLTLKNQLMSNTSVTLSFDGIPVTFFTYDYGLLHPAVDATPALGDIIILTTDIGSTPLVRIQMKDMNAVSSHPAVANTGGDYYALDGSRFLAWKTLDHTCYRVHTEMQWRLEVAAPWAQMRIMNVAVGGILGPMSTDPLSPLHWETNKIAAPKVAGVVNTVRPYAGPMTLNATSDVELVVPAATGVLTAVTGDPTPVVTAVTDAATTAGGTITITAAGAITYTSDTAYTGVDTFNYTVTNTLGTSTGTITIIVAVA